MTNLTFLDPALMAGVGALILLIALALQGLGLYVYKQDNRSLRRALESNIKSMQAERANQSKKIKALEHRVYLMKKGLKLADDPSVGVEISRTDVKVLRASATFDRSEAQYKHQSDELLLIMSRHEILKYAADFIHTEKSGDLNRITFEHTLYVVAKEEHDV